ncbi:MAG: Kelch repeat-containing protein [Planctomycetota bacterium]|jgi:hypothetical protein
MRIWLATALTLLLAAGAAAAEELKDLPANKWTKVSETPKRVIATHARLVWMPEFKKGVTWANLHYRSKQATFEQHATVNYLSPDGKWTEQVTTYPGGVKTGCGNSIGTNYVWLPGLKRLLLLQGPEYRAKRPVNTWLLDPKSGKWEEVAGKLSMTDKSTDFNPVRGNDGTSWPLFGALVYDAHNREAVSICGGCTWGRVSKEKEKLEVGDWFLDEQGEVKRVRRVLAAETGKVTEGRRWYPANSGTWTFSEEAKKWSAIPQPIGKQPPGRILPAAAYDADEKKIVMFGGDNFCGPLADTWIYDCEKREWSQAEPKTSPPPRACGAMVYVADQKCVLLCGGFGAGWKTLGDTWIYVTAKNEWVKLAADLPAPSWLPSAAYDPESRAVLYLSKTGRGKATVVLGLRLDLASATKAPAPAPLADGKQYHCKIDKQWGAPLPAEWDSEKNKGTDPEAGKKELAALPANTWVLREPPMPSRARQWGSYAYDPRTHRAYAWGGGHYGYTGCEMSEYDVLRNRWRSMNDIVGYKVNWRRGAAGGIPGPSFQGWKLMGTHARKSYAVDYITNSVVTTHGDVYSIAENRFVSNMGRCPGGYGVGDQVCFENTPDGIYGYHSKGGPGQVWLADVKAGKWNLIKKEKTGGPRGHNEYGTLCHDRKRNRLFYTNQPRGKERMYWSYDITAKEWTEVKPANKCPGLLGCPTYVDDMDAIL